MAPGITMMDYGRGTIKAKNSKNVRQMSHLLPLAFSCPTVSILRQIVVRHKLFYVSFKNATVNSF